MLSVCTGQQFGTAVCEHLGLDTERVCEVKVESGLDQVFGVNIFVVLEADDLIQIGNIMKRSD